MKEKLNHLYVDSRERSLLLHSLVELKNQLIQQGVPLSVAIFIWFAIKAAMPRKIKRKGMIL